MLEQNEYEKNKEKLQADLDKLLTNLKEDNETIEKTNTALTENKEEISLFVNSLPIISHQNQLILKLSNIPKLLDELIEAISKKIVLFRKELEIGGNSLATFRVTEASIIDEIKKIEGGIKEFENNKVAKQQDFVEAKKDFLDISDEYNKVYQSYLMELRKFEWDKYPNVNYLDKFYPIILAENSPEKLVNLLNLDKQIGKVPLWISFQSIWKGKQFIINYLNNKVRAFYVACMQKALESNGDLTKIGGDLTKIANVFRSTGLKAYLDSKTLNHKVFNSILVIERARQNYLQKKNDFNPEEEEALKRFQADLVIKENEHERMKRVIDLNSVELDNKKIAFEKIKTKFQNLRDLIIKFKTSLDAELPPEIKTETPKPKNPSIDIISSSQEEQKKEEQKDNESINNINSGRGSEPNANGNINKSHQINAEIPGSQSLENQGFSDQTEVTVKEDRSQHATSQVEEKKPDPKTPEEKTSLTKQDCINKIILSICKAFNYKDNLDSVMQETKEIIIKSLMSLHNLNKNANLYEKLRRYISKDDSLGLFIEDLLDSVTLAGVITDLEKFRRTILKIYLISDNNNKEAIPFLIDFNKKIILAKKYSQSGIEEDLKRVLNVVKTEKLDKCPNLMSDISKLEKNEELTEAKNFLFPVSLSDNNELTKEVQEASKSSVQTDISSHVSLEKKSAPKEKPNAKQEDKKEENSEDASKEIIAIICDTYNKIENLESVREIIKETLKISRSIKILKAPRSTGWFGFMSKTKALDPLVAEFLGCLNEDGSINGEKSSEFDRAALKIYLRSDNNNKEAIPFLIDFNKKIILAKKCSSKKEIDEDLKLILDEVISQKKVLDLESDLNKVSADENKELTEVRRFLFPDSSSNNENVVTAEEISRITENSAQNTPQIPTATSHSSNEDKKKDKKEEGMKEEDMKDLHSKTITSVIYDSFKTAENIEAARDCILVALKGLQAIKELKASSGWLNFGSKSKALDPLVTEFLECVNKDGTLNIKKAKEFDRAALKIYLSHINENISQTAFLIDLEQKTNIARNNSKIRGIIDQDLKEILNNVIKEKFKETGQLDKPLHKEGKSYYNIAMLFVNSNGENANLPINQPTEVQPLASPLSSTPSNNDATTFKLGFNTAHDKPKSNKTKSELVEDLEASLESFIFDKLENFEALGSFDKIEQLINKNSSTLENIEAKHQEEVSQSMWDKANSFFGIKNISSSKLVQGFYDLYKEVKKVPVTQQNRQEILRPSCKKFVKLCIDLYLLHPKSKLNKDEANSMELKVQLGRRVAIIIKNNESPLSKPLKDWLIKLVPDALKQDKNTTEEEIQEDSDKIYYDIGNELVSFARLERKDYDAGFGKIEKNSYFNSSATTPTLTQ